MASSKRVASDQLNDFVNAGPNLAKKTVIGKFPLLHIQSTMN